MGCVTSINCHSFVQNPLKNRDPFHKRLMRKLSSCIHMNVKTIANMCICLCLYVSVFLCLITERLFCYVTFLQHSTSCRYFSMIRNVWMYSSVFESMCVCNELCSNYTCMNISIYTCVNISIYTRGYVCKHIFMYVLMYAEYKYYACMYACSYVCV